MFVLLLLLLLGIFQWIPSNGLLNTSSGIYLGRTVRYQNLLVEQYLGIEYARIIRRFDRAQVIRRDENSSIINATTFGSICKPTISVCANNTNSCTVSYGIFTSKFSADEQCLYLNVFLPKKSQEKKSIFMWIHGGSSQIGTGNLFDGTILAALGNIIVITFNFRLNLFGFLSSGDERLEGNLGLYDQSLVLDWIYENSEALGGDKQRITIGGHSAGAPHAYYLAKSRFNQGRIRRLILQSGCPLNIWSHIQANQAIDRFNVVVHDNQCGMMDTFDEKMQCLRERDYLSIVEHEYHAFTSANHTNVVIHGDLMNGFRENQSLPDVDILIGANDDEGAYVAVVPILMESESQDTIMLHNVNYTELSLKFLAAMQPDKTCLHHEALQLYQIHPMPDNCSESVDCYCAYFYNYSRLISDILFFNDYYRFFTETIQSSNRTYVYQYSYPTSQKHPTLCHGYFQEHHLVGHFAELEYTWGTPLLFENHSSDDHLLPLIHYNRHLLKNTTEIYTEEQMKFTRDILEQWSNFINYGQPNSSKYDQQWLSISHGWLMQLQIPRSVMKPFAIPSNVQFWMKTCSNTTLEQSQSIYDEISWILYFSTSLCLMIELF